MAADTGRADAGGRPGVASIAGPAAWRGGDLAQRNDWIHPLTADEVAGLEDWASRLHGRPFDAIRRDDAPAGALAPALAGWRAALAHGRGFVLIRGLPVDRLSADDAARVYWALGLHLGSPVPQNLAGELLTDVRDTGADPGDPGTRLYRTRAEQDFHTDGADIIGLLCLRTARRGGESRIVSSVTVYNEVLRQRPDLAALLFQDFYWHYHEPQLERPLYFVRPICTPRGAALNTSFIPWYIRRAQEIDGVPPLSAAQRDAIALVETTANDPALYLDMEFRPGDIQLLKNSVILHKRTAYEDWPDEAQRRHLLRLWLAAPEFDDGDEQLRGGIRI